MMIESRSDGFLDHDLARLRREWVAAYRAWTQVADGRALTSTGLTDGQRAALGRYRAAEATYFTHLRTTPTTVKSADETDRRHDRAQIGPGGS
jgi:hypothetical protein